MHVCVRAYRLRYAGVAGVSKLVTDLELVFTNCMEYNEEGSDLHTIAAGLKRKHILRLSTDINTNIPFIHKCMV